MLDILQYEAIDLSKPEKAMGEALGSENSPVLVLNLKMLKESSL